MSKPMFKASQTAAHEVMAKSGKRSADKVSTKKADRQPPAPKPQKTPKGAPGDATPSAEADDLLVPLLIRLPAGLVRWLNEERFARKATTRTDLIRAILSEAKGK